MEPVTRNALTVLGDGDSKFQHIFDKMQFKDRNFTVPSEDEQFEQEQMSNLAGFADFFNLGSADPETVLNFVGKQAEEAETVNAEKLKPMSEETLRVVSDKQRAKKVDEARFVYKRAEAENRGLTEPSWSKSTDDVVKPKGSAESVSNHSQERMQSTYGTSTSSAASSSSGTRTVSSAPVGEPRDAMGNFHHMNSSVQRLGTQRTVNWKPYKETEEEYFARFAKNTPIWKRMTRPIKNFLKSGKGQITAKMGIVILLQMGMAIFGKKYKFESFGQLFAMFSLMLASFYMTRELAGEGLDVSSMIF